MTPHPSSLDLATLNAAQKVATQALQSLVCKWEQEALNAAHRGEYRSAQQYKDWGFAADIAVHSVSGAVGALFLKTLEAMPLVQDTRTVKLPELNRTEKDRHLDALAVEVASEQPEPSA
jgi:hypothetical protein